MQHLLLVSNDSDTSHLLNNYLTHFGFVVHTASSADLIRKLLATQPVKLVVLDVLLPGPDGLNLTRELRENSRIPIIMLSASSNTYDLVLAFEMGVDDYVNKPFEARELLARIQAVLRRAGGIQDPQPEELEVVHFDGWQLHRMERQLLTPAGMVIPLSNAEFRLLHTFLSMPRRICTRERLMENTRGRSMETFERSIDLLVSRLRQKLGDDPRAPRFIKTVRGAGYIMNVRSIKGRISWSV